MSSLKLANLVLFVFTITALQLHCVVCIGGVDISSYASCNVSGFVDAK